MITIKHLWRFRKEKVEIEKIDLSKQAIFTVVSLGSSGIADKISKKT